MLVDLLGFDGSGVNFCDLCRFETHFERFCQSKKMDDCWNSVQLCGSFPRALVRCHTIQSTHRRGFFRVSKTSSVANGNDSGALETRVKEVHQVQG
jgi:hypothetical protein